MKRILIEFFDEENLNNCISQLYYKYNEVYYFYFARQKDIFGIDPIFAALCRFNKKFIKIIPEFTEINGENPDEVIKAIDRVYNTEDQFDFDITGGPDPFSYAVGMFIAEKKPQNVRVHYYDFQGRKFYRTYPAFCREEAQPEIKLPADELIKLQASLIANEKIKGAKKFRPEIGENEYSDHIKKIWNCVKNYPKEWNTFCSLRNENRIDLIKTCAAPDDIILKHFGADTSEKYAGFLNKLANAGIITIKILTQKYVSYIINLPEEQRFLLDKGGNIFEMYAYYVARSSGRYVDCCVGVNVDWDGVVNNKDEEVNNEVDLILSDGCRSFFISCKNTKIENECVYEIDTVTRYYGGSYARPVIFSSTEASDAIKKRAEESEIVLIDNIAKMNENTFRAKIKELL